MDASGNTYQFFLRINPGRFHYLKFLLEGYDNLAVLSSVDSKEGVIKLRCPPGMVTELMAILEGEVEKIR